MTWCCPCVTFGRNAEILDEGWHCKYIIYTTKILFINIDNDYANLIDLFYNYWIKLIVACFCLGLGYCLLMSAQFHWIWSCFYREKLRAKFGLPAEPCCDCCVHFCCNACALCQEHAELKARGLDPAKG